MTSPYQYSYLLMDIIFLVFWLVFFFGRKDTRKEMLTISIICAIVSPFMQYYIYAKDWWLPKYIFGMIRFGIEDVLYGFTCGGIFAVMYEVVFRKKVKKWRKQQKQKIIRLLIPVLGSLMLFFGAFLLFKINSFYASIVAVIIPTIFMLVQRPDLIKNSLMSGILFLILTMFVYSLVEYVTPGWIHAFWYFVNTPEIIWMNIPLDDITWYILVGMFLGPLYEYWQDGRLGDIKN